jgi:hypothetical protein
MSQDKQYQKSKARNSGREDLLSEKGGIADIQKPKRPFRYIGTDENGVRLSSTFGNEAPLISFEK